VELNATKIDGYVILVLRDVSRERSYEKVIRMAREIERLLPYFDPGTLNKTLQKYFEAEIIWEKDSKKEDFEIPISFHGETFGYLRIRFPSWFVLHHDVLELLRALAEDIGESVMMKRYAEAINKALNGLQEASRDFAILVDGIRNPLAVISLFAELLNGEFEKKIRPQVERILNLVEQIEEGWMLVENLEKELRENFEKYFNN
jgi:signal transduction histidine kinase